MRVLVALLAVAMLLATGRGAVAQVTRTNGGGQSYFNVKPSVTFHFIICEQGAYPQGNDGTLQQTDRSIPLVGEIRVMAFTNTPAGWFDCYGQLLNISQHVNLFSQLFNNFGGNGSSTFGLPDLYGAVPIGVGQGPGLPNYVIGQKVGFETTFLFLNDLPTHTHTIPSGNTGATGGGLHTIDNLQPSLPIHFYIDANGEIMMHAGHSVPYGFAECDGSFRDPNIDTTLFNIIGTSYGGDGVTTFALPDLRGRSPVGTNSAGIENNVSGTIHGAPTVTLLPSNIPTHNHFVTNGSNFTGNTGSSFAFDKRQPTMAMTWLINYTGNATNSPNGPPFLGEMRLSAAPVPPNTTGWLSADGGALFTPGFTALHNTIGNAYGGGGSFFNVPDLKARMAAGLGNSFTSLGVILGADNTTLAVSNMPVHNHPLPSAPILTRPQSLGDGTYQILFTNVPNNTFTLLTSTNATLPLSNWTSLGPITNFTSGYYQYTFTPTNGPKRFYAVRLP